MATYRLIERAGSAFKTFTFPTYDEALKLCRDIQTGKPQKRLTSDGIAWAVVVPNFEAAKPVYKKMETVQKPVIDMSLVIEVLRWLPDVKAIEADFEPQPFIERRSKPRDAAEKDGNVAPFQEKRAPYMNVNLVDSLPDTSPLGWKPAVPAPRKEWGKPAVRRPFNGLPLEALVSDGRHGVTC
jgi:hypothetical protein